jgi:molybdate transport system substrate-binding protein
MLLPLSSPGYAAELDVLASNGVKSALETLAPHFERESGHRLHVRFGLASALQQQIEAGTRFDLALLTRAGIAALSDSGRVRQAGQADIARSRIGVGIRAGAPRPDISTEQAFTQALLGADSVTWAENGASGQYVAGLLKRLNLTGQLMSKVRLASSGPDVGARLVSGDAQLGILLVNELMAVPGVDVVGPLPAALQKETVFTAAVSASALSPDAAQSLIEFLKSPQAQAVFRTKGQEPG